MAAAALAGPRYFTASADHGGIFRCHSLRDHFQARSDEIIARISPASSSEICIHPGYPPSSVHGAAGETAAPDAFASSAFRQIEHDALVDPEIADIVGRRRLRLMSFAGSEKKAR